MRSRSMIYDETDGNPLFTGEVLRHLRETGAIYEQDGRWTTRGDVTAIGIPDGVREVIGRRLSRLSDHTNEVLQLAAVVGRNFDLAVLEHLVDYDRDDLVTSLDEAVEARVVTEVGRGALHVLPRARALRALRRAAPDPPGPPPRAGRARRSPSCSPTRSSPTSASSRITTPTASAPVTSTRPSSTRSSRGSGRWRSSPSTTRVTWFRRPATSSRTASGDAAQLAHVLMGLGIAREVRGGPRVP